MKTVKEIFDKKARPGSSIRGFAGFTTSEIAEIQKDAQEQASKYLLNHLLVPTIRIENDCEYPMTTQERVDWAIANLRHK